MMLKPLLLFLATILAFSAIFEAKTPKVKLGLGSRMVLKFEYFQDCENVSTLQVHMLMSEIQQLSSLDYVVHADYYIDEEIDKIEHALIRIQRCDDSTKASCQHFAVWRFPKNICELMIMKNQFWTPMIYGNTPLPKCPLKGTYRMRNGTLNMDVISHLPVPEIERYYWRMRIEAFRPHTFVCWDIASRIFKVRA